MSKPAKCIIALIILGLADIIIPVPITVMGLIYVIIKKPPWFIELFEEIFSQGK
ncbi:MAG: hypothetical protein JXA35_01035 [Deltaproteobacteria bacterium]|nr:hypothetical protein [Deltaproteobacteria bacterium]